MRILHITYTLRGGSGKALFRHHLRLRDSGVDSQILLGEKPNVKSPWIHVIGSLDLPQRRLGRRLEKLGNWLEQYMTDPPFAFQKSSHLAFWPVLQQADIIDIRQLHAGGRRGFFNIRAIPGLARLKPVTWRLSDMWPFTGFCAYAIGCDRWKNGCGRCPQLAGDRRQAELRKPRWDFSAYTLKAKRRAYGNSGLHIVAPSAWLLGCARESILSGARSFTEIPVGVDLQVFKPLDRTAEREKLGIAADAFVLVASHANTHNYRKAFDLLAETLSHLQNPEKVTLLLIGMELPEAARRELRVNVRSVGHLNDEGAHAACLSAADVFLFSSRCDNSPNVVLEAAACGLPTVGFDACGTPEYVQNGVTGVLVPPYDTRALAEALERYRGDPPMRREAGERARRRMETEFSLERQLELYLAHYRQIAGGGLASNREA